MKSTEKIFQQLKANPIVVEPLGLGAVWSSSEDPFMFEDYYKHLNTGDVGQVYHKEESKDNKWEYFIRYFDGSIEKMNANFQRIFVDENFKLLKKGVYFTLSDAKIEQFFSNYQRTSENLPTPFMVEKITDKFIYLNRVKCFFTSRDIAKYEGETEITEGTIGRGKIKINKSDFISVQLIDKNQADLLATAIFKYQYFHAYAATILRDTRTMEEQLADDVKHRKMRESK